jgi:hypothetical protein
MKRRNSLLVWMLVGLAVVGLSACVSDGIGIGVPGPGSGARWSGPGSGPDVLVAGGPVIH